MSDWSRQAIDVINGSRTLSLKEMNSENKREFKIMKFIGNGNSAYVYEAEYLSGGVWHRCILKELYPKECGLKRDEKDGVTLYFPKQNDDTKAADRYEIIRKRYLDAYKIQNDFRNAGHSELNNLEDKMLLAVGVSAPMGLYENKHGILYSVYESSSGLSYDNEEYRDGSLWDILSIIIQTGNVISKFHSAGYIVLDIKESNILITGDKDNRTAIQFDFGSLVKREDLKNYRFSYGKNIPLSFSDCDDPLLMPKELRIIRLNLLNRDFDSAEGFVRKSLGEYGERTDVFLLAAVLYRRLFKKLSLKDLRNNNWMIPDDAAEYLTLPTIREKLKIILSKALADDSADRYETMKDLIDDLRYLRTLSVLENKEDRERFVSSGIIWSETEITKGMIRYSSCRHWEELSSEHGKFSQLIKFAGRFDSKVSLVDELEKRIMPYEAIEKNKLVLLTGDGGMGKSTAVFDYWTKQRLRTGDNSKICLYVDLSHFSSICETSRNDSLKNGRSADFPTELLAFIEINILQKFSITPKVARLNDAMYDPAMFQQMSALNDMLSSETGTTEFMVILDGYNEILNSFDRAAFEANLDKAINTWKNASFVVTSRAFDNDTENVNADNVFAKLRKFSFVGIPDDDIKAAIKKHKHMSDEEISALKNDKIREILKIPMFLNMYLALHTEDTKAVHTRGELLDRFILGYEPMTADRISDPCDKEKTGHLQLRKFLVKYSLPFAANDMDQNRVYLSNKNDFLDKISLGNILYLTRTTGKNKASVYDDHVNVKDKNLSETIGFNKKDYVDYTFKAGMSGSEAMELFFSKDTMETIIKDETGYCYNTLDGKIAFTHQYYRDYFAAKQIQNILSAAESLGNAGLSRDDQLAFIKDNGLDYTWSDDVCVLLGEIIGDYHNEHKEE